MRRAWTFAWLVLLWVVLWRDLSLANLLSGALLAAGLSIGIRPRPSRHRVHPVALLRFAGHFAWKLLEANLILAREVVTPQNRINTGIIAVPLPRDSDTVVTIVGDAVSLTPGTLTLEVRHDPDPVLYVHVLHLQDLDDARADVEHMASLVRAAFRTSTAAPGEVSAP